MEVDNRLFIHISKSIDMMFNIIKDCKDLKVISYLRLLGTIEQQSRKSAAQNIIRKHFKGNQQDMTL